MPSTARSSLSSFGSENPIPSSPSQSSVDCSNGSFPEENGVESASKRAFLSLPDLRKAVSELTVLKGVGPATASAVLAAYAPEVAPFMSDEAMLAALGNAKEYTLKQYLSFAEKLQNKAKELSTEEEPFTPSDVERALWSSAIASKLSLPPNDDPNLIPMRSAKRKRKS